MKAIAVFSGGLDSTVMLAELASAHEVSAITVDYGQRHRREIEAAKAITERLGIEHKIVDLSGLAALMGGSSQTDLTIPVPHGHYTAEQMKQTVVPNRNMLLLAVAGAWAISKKAFAVFYGAHAGDHAIYPDCREEFVAPLAQALWAADWHHVRIERPFIALTKADIIRRGAELGRSPEEYLEGKPKPRPYGIGYDLMDLSYSCYEGKLLHCGLCGTCSERRSAFRDAGVPDPTSYDPAGIEKLPDSALIS